MPHRNIRVKLSKDGDWVTVRLLQIADGWVEVDAGGGPLWVMTKRCHPDDMSDLARNKKKRDTKKFKVIKIDDPPS